MILDMNVILISLFVFWLADTCNDDGEKCSDHRKGGRCGCRKPMDEREWVGIQSWSRKRELSTSATADVFLWRTA